MSDGTGHVDELVGVYALGALTKSECTSFEAHLEKCSRCRALAADARSIVAALPLSADPITPSSECKRKLFEQIAAAEKGTSAAPVPHPIPAGAARAARPGVPIFRPTLVNLFSRLVPGLAAAGLLLAVTFGMWGWSEHSQSEQVQAQVAAQKTQVAERDAMMAVLSAPDLRAHALTGTRAAPSAWGKLYVAPRQAAAVLMVYDLTPCPPGRVYELWMVRDQKPVPMGTFKVGADGAGHLLVQASESVNSFQAGGISVEPEGGSPVPTGDMLLSVGF